MLGSKRSPNPFFTSSPTMKLVAGCWLFTILVCAPLFAATSAAGSVERVYLDASLQAEQVGKYAEALAFVQKGLEISPDASDLLYHLGRLKLQGTMVSRESLDAFRRSMQANNFNHFKLEQACAMFYRQLRLQGYLAELETDLVSRFSLKQLIDQPMLCSEAVLFYEQAGKKAQARNMLSQAMQRYPDDYHLVLTALELNAMPSVSLGLVLDRKKEQSPEYLQALWTYIQRIVPSKERAERTAMYLSLGGRHPLAYVLQYEDGALAEEQAYAGFVKAGGLANREALLQFLKALDGKTAQANLQSLLAGDAVEVYADRDNNSYQDIRYRFRKGQLETLAFDYDQDGQYETVSQWVNGKPNELSYTSTQGETWKFSYNGLYPYVARCWYQAEVVSLEFVYPYRSMEEVWIDLPSEPGSVATLLSTLALPEPFLPDFSEIAGLSHTVLARLPAGANQADHRLGIPARFLHEVPQLNAAWFGKSTAVSNGNIASSGKIFLKMIVEAGQPLYSYVDEDGDGSFDHEYYYDKGIVAAGFRDIDGDGNFRTIEIYENKRLLEVKYDQQTWSYLYKPDSGISIWDLDRNNKLDVMELRKAGRQIWQKSSSSGNTEPDTYIRP